MAIIAITIMMVIGNDIPNIFAHSKSLLLWMLLWLFHFVIFCLLSILLHITHLSFVNEIITRHCTIFMFPNLRDRHNVHILNPLYRNIQHFSTLIATLLFSEVLNMCVLVPFPFAPKRIVVFLDVVILETNLSIGSNFLI